MARRSSATMPAVGRILAELGENVRLARQRRGLQAQLVAERAGMSRPTLRAIERGAEGVTMGAVANVLHTLGLVEDLRLVARDDAFARKLEVANLVVRQRVRRSKPTATKRPVRRNLPATD